MNKSFYLENIPQAQKEAGERKFLRPSDAEIDNLAIGDVVRLFFIFKFNTDDGCRAERMWVEIFEITSKGFKGYLTTQPAYIKDISKGDIIEFARENIATVIVKLNFDLEKKALVSKRAVENREINYAFKDSPDNDMDSGWQLFYGDEDDEYNSDADNIMLLSLEDILDFEPRLENVISSKHTEFEWCEEKMAFIKI